MDERTQLPQDSSESPPSLPRRPAPVDEVDTESFNRHSRKYELLDAVDRDALWFGLSILEENAQAPEDIEERRYALALIKRVLRDHYPLEWKESGIVIGFLEYALLSQKKRESLYKHIRVVELYDRVKRENPAYSSRAVELEVAEEFGITDKQVRRIIKGVRDAVRALGRK